MMKRDYYFLYIILSLGLLVPVPGRFAYGVIMLLLLNVLLFAGVFFKRLIKLLKIEEFQSVLISVLLVSVCILYKQLLILLSPVMVLSLGFAIYIPAVSSFLIGYLGENFERPLKNELVECMTKAGKFSIFGFIFFIIRDVFGYGTFTLPMHNGILELRIFNIGTGYIGSFLASIPGALVLTSLFVILLEFIKKKFEIVQLTNDVREIQKSEILEEGENK